MRKNILILMCAGMGLAACTDKNPLLEQWNTPFETPPFDKIELRHFKPAFEEAIRVNNEEIRAITENPEVPTFENTIVALDNSGRLLSRVNAVFGALKANMADDKVQALSRDITPILTSHRGEINMNERLFARIKDLYGRKDSLGLDPLQMRTLEKYYDRYVRQGAALDREQKEELKRINNELAMANLRFNENLLKETNNYMLVIDDEADLAGLPESVVAAAAHDASNAGMEGKWVFTTHKPSMLPFLQYADNRELRRQLYNAYYHRGDNGNEYDNKHAVNDIIGLSLRKAKLLGYETYSDYMVSNNMAGDPENVYELLGKLWNPALATAKNELRELQRVADREGKGVEVKGWDWWYYAEKLRKEKFDFDEQELRPYLKLENVRDGLFRVANKLYGITLEKRTDIPVYQDDMETYEVKDANGDHLAVLYLDYFPRPVKEQGAWCSGLRGYRWNGGDEVYPLVTISTNFTKPVGDQPALLSWDEAETLFHEFGHALQSFFSRGKYGMVEGNIPRDMIELPSQIMENWIAQPEVLRDFARHYATGEIIPDELIDKMHAAGRFNKGWATTEHVAAALLDMDWYTRRETGDVDVDAFEKNAMEKYGLIEEIYPRYRTTFFAHIFGGGYASGYYVYKWAEVLDADAFQAFVETGDIFDPQTAERFRKYILEEGGYDDGMVQYVKFRGKEPSVEPLMRKYGF